MKKDLIYEGKAKIVYSCEKHASEEQELVIQHFKDDATAFNNEKHAVLVGKGKLNCAISTKVFSALNSSGFSTHFIKKLNDREQLIQKCKIIPLEVIVRNVIAGSFSKRWGRKEGTELPFPVVEFSLKNDTLGDPLITEDEIVAMDITDSHTLSEMKFKALRVNDFLCGFFSSVNIQLFDFKIEFGTNKDEEILLADEISPDTCRLRDMSSSEIMDKDLFRKDSGDLVSGYKEVAKRLGV